MRDAPDRCPCGRAWGRGLRFGRTPEPVPVLVDWEGCGAEWPPPVPRVEACKWGHPVAAYGRWRRSGKRWCRVCNADRLARHHRAGRRRAA